MKTIKPFLSYLSYLLSDQDCLSLEKGKLEEKIKNGKKSLVFCRLAFTDSR